MFFRSINNLFVLNIISFYIKSYLIRYPAPSNIGYFWNYGSLAIFFLVIQIVTGLFLAMFYTPHIDYAFLSIEHIMNNISYGWFVRYFHANGASFFFFVVYIHILRGIFYSSYQFPRTNLWISGVTIYFLLMGTAFLGYVLPWGQMSFWAATVITNLLTVLPYIGEEIVYWIWGGYSINNATLNRFFCLHFLLPFLVALLVCLHLILLHQTSSTTELQIKLNLNSKISFFPYFIIKDLVTVLLFSFFISVIVFYIPEMFNHSINYVPANPLVTPSHIVPEWYFLPFYAILRSILNKTFGIITMFVSMAILYFFPILDQSISGIKVFSLFSKRIFWFFSLNFIYLGFLGSQTAEYPCVELGLLCTYIHLVYCIIYLPLIADLYKWMIRFFTCNLNSQPLFVDSKYTVPIRIYVKQEKWSMNF